MLSVRFEGRDLKPKGDTRQCLVTTDTGQIKPTKISQDGEVLTDTLMKVHTSHTRLHWHIDETKSHTSTLNPLRRVRDG